tara:strand:+ start:1531 stop:2829 length:1299 start_codon:yes stop_codon:yes gene_type:complete
MPTLSSGDTLSLKSLGTATGTSSGSGVSLNAINGSAGATVQLSQYAIDSVGSVSGFTYVVESTTETFRLNFSGSGSKFTGAIADRSPNFQWSVGSGAKMAVSSNSGETAAFAASALSNVGDGEQQTELQTVVTHTVRVKFDDTYNGHATNFDANRDKTVYVVDSYDNNAASLCLTADSPITKWDGSIVEVGDLDEGDELLGYNPNNLNLDSDDDFFEWNARDVHGEFCKVQVRDIIYSFASSYYNINDGEITATSEHPMLVWDNEQQIYKFKEIFRIKVGDRLIKAAGGVKDGVIEVDVDSINHIKESVEIVSINVEDVDTYLVNGYITHNKGGNSHTDTSAPSAVTGLSWSQPTLSWSAYSGATAYDFQVSAVSNFGSTVANETEWSSTDAELIDGYSLSAGTTYYARVRAIKSGLAGTYSSTLSFTTDAP